MPSGLADDGGEGKDEGVARATPDVLALEVGERGLVEGGGRKEGEKGGDEGDKRSRGAKRLVEDEDERDLDRTKNEAGGPRRPSALGEDPVVLDSGAGRKVVVGRNDNFEDNDKEKEDGAERGSDGGIRHAKVLVERGRGELAVGEQVERLGRSCVSGLAVLGRAGGVARRQRWQPKSLMLHYSVVIK